MDERAPRLPNAATALEPVPAGERSPSEGRFDMPASRARTAPLLHVIDDDTVFLAGIERVLRKLDCTVHVFASPEEALACFADEEPDLIFVDVHMPRLDGVEFLQRALGSRREHRARLFLDSAGPPSVEVRRWCGQHRVELVDKREMLDRDWMRGTLESWCRRGASASMPAPGPASPDDRP